jgi:hypothetical protein
VQEFSSRWIRLYGPVRTTLKTLQRYSFKNNQLLEFNEVFLCVCSRGYRAAPWSEGVYNFRTDAAKRLTLRFRRRRYAGSTREGDYCLELTFTAGSVKPPPAAAALRATVLALTTSRLGDASCCVRERARSTIPSNIGMRESGGSG